MNINKIFAFKGRLLSYVKRCESYETIGGLFAEITKDSVELSLTEKIGLLIIGAINVIAEILNYDVTDLINQVVSNDKKLKALKDAFDKLTAAA